MIQCIDTERRVVCVEWRCWCSWHWYCYWPPAAVSLLQKVVMMVQLETQRQADCSLPNRCSATRQDVVAATRSEPGVTLVGPSMAQIGTAADTRVSGQSAEEYLRESIVAPNDFVAEGFAENLMPATYGSELTEEEISDLVSFLLAQK